MQVPLLAVAVASPAAVLRVLVAVAVAVVAAVVAVEVTAHREVTASLPPPTRTASRASLAFVASALLARVPAVVSDVTVMPVALALASARSIAARVPLAVVAGMAVSRSLVRSFARYSRVGAVVAAYLALQQARQGRSRWQGHLGQGWRRGRCRQGQDRDLCRGRDH